MAPFRLARPKYLAWFGLELGLVLASVAGLALLTARWVPSLASNAEPASVLLVGGLFAVILIGTQWANPSDSSSVRRELILFSLFSVVACVLYFAASWVLGGESGRMSGLLALEAALVVPASVALWRWLSVRYNIFNITRENIVIVGTTEMALQVCRWIVSEHGSEYAVLGFAERGRSRLGTILTMGVRIQTDLESLAQFCAARADRVIVALEEKRGTLPVLQLMELRLRGVEIEEATSFIERSSGKVAVETMLPSWLIFSEGFRTTRLKVAMKRTADLVLSLLLLILAGPVMLLAALLVRLDSRGPALYRQTRMGRDGREFQVLKFRSMRLNAESQAGPTWAAEDDPRITRVGRVLRRLRIDELPQLFNVLRGEMSFVGPRPERRHFVEQLRAKIPYYGLRMIVRPGITGWAQVEYGYGASEEDALEKLKYDLYYIKNHNLLFDFWITLKTIKVVLFGKGVR